MQIKPRNHNAVKTIKIAGLLKALSDMPQNWQPISTAPLDQDLELAVMENGDAHALVFSCRRAAQGWINASTGKLIEVNPTHWRDWREKV
jgi:hypothetical protein